MPTSFLRWLIVLIALVVLTAGVGAFLALQEAAAASRIVVGAGVMLVNAWLLYALIRWRQVKWVARLNTLLIMTAVAALLAGACWSLGFDNGLFFVVSAWAMAAVFIAGLWLLRLILSPGYATVGVARTLLDEAIRMKTPLVFIVLLMLLVPVLPMIVSGQDVLRYRVQTFLMWSMMVTSVLLSLMTIFLAVGSVTGEIEKKQIFLTLTKPVGRVQYLLGKWIGIAALNLLLVAVAGAGIYAMTMWLARQPAKTSYDTVMVREQVLTARRAIPPRPANTAGLQSMVNERLQRLQMDDPATYGQPGTPLDALPPEVTNPILKEAHQSWFTLGPNQRTVYRFTGLGNVHGARTLQLRFKPTAAGSTSDGFIHLQFRIDGRPYLNPYAGQFENTVVFRFVAGEYHVVDLPASLIGDDGQMDIEMFNMPSATTNQPEPSLAFNIGDGIEMLYKVGSFEGNLLRSLVILWIKLLFLGMLGIFASTFLGFPVACLLCCLIYIGAAGHGYLTQSMEFYAAFPKDTLPLWDRVIGVPMAMLSKIEEGKYFDAFKVLIRLIGGAFTSLVPSFAEYDPAPKLSDGRVVDWSLLGRAALWIGLIWTGVVGLLAAGAFHRRELAQVQV